MRSFDEMNRLFDEMNREIEQIRAGWWAGAYPALESGHDHDADFGSSSAAREETALSLEEGDDEYVFVMDLPGFEREEIDLVFEDDALSVHASHDVDDGEDHHVMRSRRIARTVSIPGRVDEEGITASYRNGVLEVRLPIEGDREDGHRIEIE